METYTDENEESVNKRGKNVAFLGSLERINGIFIHFYWKINVIYK